MPLLGDGVGEGWMVAKESGARLSVRSRLERCASSKPTLKVVRLPRRVVH
jgi:hypothetical protein